MKIIEKIYSLIKPKKKGKVLIKSQFGLSVLKICSVVLADCGVGGGCSFLSFMPPLEIPKEPEKESEEETKVKIKDNEDLYPTYKIKKGIETNKDKIDNQSLIVEIFLKNCDQKLKEKILSLGGIDTIIFGKAITKEHSCEALRITFNPNLIDLMALIEIYSNASGKKEIFFKGKNQKNELLEILKSIETIIPIFELISFEP